MSKKKFSGRFSGKGYYIALVLCAVAIGVSGFLYYRNADADPKDPNQAVISTDGTGGNQTNPTNNPTDNQQDPTDNQDPTPTTPTKMQTTRPVSGEVIGQYAMDCLSYNETTRDWRTHNGIDIAAEAGTPVCAAADGTVYTVYVDEMMGTTVVIRHEGDYVTKYSSLAESVKVAPGDRVVMGQTIGSVGKTALVESAIGDHVHFSVTCNDKNIDPEEFLQ